MSDTEEEIKALRRQREKEREGDAMEVDEKPKERRGRRRTKREETPPEEEEEMQDVGPQKYLRELAEEEDENPVDPFAEHAQKRQVSARESEYQLRRFNRDGGLVQKDAFEQGGEEGEGATYAEAMRLQRLEKEEERVRKAIEAKEEETRLAIANGEEVEEEKGNTTPRKRRWDVSPEREEKPVVQEDDQKPVKKRRSRWDEAPDPTAIEPAATATAAPAPAAPAPKKRSRWDEAPTQENTPSALQPAPAQIQAAPTMFLSDYDRRNRPLTDEELDELLPIEGYEIVEPPPGYAPLRTPARKLTDVPAQAGGFTMQDEASAKQMAAMAAPDLPTDIEGVGQLAFFKLEDQQHFQKILGPQDESGLTVDELKERKILRLLLKIKNGTPPMRKTALRQITDNARQFGAGPLFDKILPLLMERSLEEQERHLLVKVIDRVLYKLDDLVRPYVHKILVVIEPLLIDQDRYARIEGREIISNLSKAAGLAHMISTMRPDIDHSDEYVRNTTARAFSVVASALGIPSLLPFLRAVCKSMRSWQARHTGIKIVQQIAIMMGCAVLPYLDSLVDAVAHGLKDEQQKVRIMTALAISALAEAATPYGIESFDSVLKPLWNGIRKHRGKGLAAFLKAIGFIVPLMSPEYANDYTKGVIDTLLREFKNPDDEMKKIVLKVVEQCSATDGVEPAFIKSEIIPPFFESFWVRRIATDKRTSRQVIDTTVQLAQKAGVSEIVGRIVSDLKDENELYRKMVMETIHKVIASLGTSDIDERLEYQLVDGMIHAFHEQSVEDWVMLDGFGTVVNAFGTRIRPYLLQIVSAILHRLANKNAKVRQQAADLVSKLAVVIKQCGEDQLLSKLGIVLFEQLGEEYPDALGSIIAAEASIANVVGMTQMNPPVKDLLPRMTPILRNRHEKVQEASINLIGRIADRGAEYVSAREWMRICFELVDLLKAHKKAIRRAAVNSFGYIAKAIGPQDVLSVLLTNLRVQERQSRVCSCVAIAIVAESCGPFTCIPAILNEYRTPELNVRNGCLKAMSFIFEYIGEMGKDYIHSVLTCLEDALTDRDPVHRQTASAIVKHLALGTAGLGNEDALMHLLNLVWPNILEQSPHLINNVSEAVEAMRVGLGPGIVLSYCLQGLFHPARRLREIYWRTYNTLYLGAEDAMVPYYPALPELSDDRNQYDRDVLYMWV